MIFVGRLKLNFAFFKDKCKTTPVTVYGIFGQNLKFFKLRNYFLDDIGD